MSELMFPHDKEVDEYRGWSIRVDKHPMEVFDSAPAGAQTSIKSLWVANVKAIKPVKGGPGWYYTIQPLWITEGQARICRTSLDLESITRYVIDNGKRLVRKSIDRYEDGLDKPEIMRDPSPDGSDTAKPRVHVTPQGLQIDPPAKEELPGTS